MAESLEPLRSEAFTDQQQVAYFHSRERRKSLAGVPELHRTHQIRGAGSIEISPLDTDALFPNRDRTITFKTAIRFGSGLHSGLIFGFGDASNATALWIDGQEISFRSGRTGADAALAVFDNGVSFSEGLELDIVAAVIPGLGRIQFWLNGRPTIINEISSSGDFGSPLSWSAAADGSFADAAAGALPTDVTQTGAPSNFQVIESLSVFVGQIPRQMYR